MNEQKPLLRDTIATWLQEQGHRTEQVVQEDRYGLVLFQTRGRHFAVRVDEFDPTFLYLTLEMTLPETLTNELLARRAAALAESNTKVVKVEIGWETRQLTIAAEQLVAEPGGAAIFWPTIAILDDSVSRLGQAIDEVVGQDAAAHFTEQLEAELAGEDGSQPPRRATMRQPR